MSSQERMEGSDRKIGKLRSTLQNEIARFRLVQSRNGNPATFLTRLNDDKTAKPKAFLREVDNDVDEDLYNSLEYKDASTAQQARTEWRIAQQDQEYWPDDEWLTDLKVIFEKGMMVSSINCSTQYHFFPRMFPAIPIDDPPK